MKACTLVPREAQQWWQTRKLTCKSGEWGTLPFDSRIPGCNARSSLTFPLKSVPGLVKEEGRDTLPRPSTCSPTCSSSKNHLLVQDSPRAMAKAQLPAAASAWGAEGLHYFINQAGCPPFQSSSSLRNCELYLLLESSSPWRSRCQAVAASERAIYKHIKEKSSVSAKSLVLVLVYELC